MIALAIDTTHEWGSLALSFGPETVQELPLHAPDGYGSVLFDSLSRLLERGGIGLNDVDIFAAAAGPGSFTGVRIGLAAVKGLAEASGKGCYGVSNLAAMAQSGTARMRAAILDARRGEVYGGVFGDYVQPETVAPLAKWLAALPRGVSEFLAFDFTPWQAELDASPFAEATRTPVRRAMAGAIAGIALERARLGEPSDPALLDANYVRRSDAELLWKDR